MAIEMYFHIWDDGDETIGDYGNRAELSTDVDFLDGEDRREYIKSIKEALSAAFASIWNNRCVHVASEEDLRAGDCDHEDRTPREEVR